MRVHATIPRLLVVVCAVAIAAAALIPASCSDAAGCPGVRAPQPTDAQSVLLDPAGEAFQSEPPDTFRVRFETSTGPFTVEVIRAWAPRGAQRFYDLVRNGFFDGNRFFRVIPGAIVQFGVHGVPAIQNAWNEHAIPDDPVLMSNERGTITFATAGPDTRTTQLFVNYRSNEGLDAQGFAPIGRVTEGMGALTALYSEYGEMAGLGGPGVDYGCMLTAGNAYLERRFERLDFIETARIIHQSTTPGR
ncbi:MAG: peptidylprolyl isomerase [Gemmatimonadetes bacterium]|nr:peptidylprolyl isomerase [Gemmatimonadota bacterium]